MVEYGLIIALIAVVLITVLTNIGGGLNRLFGKVEMCIRDRDYVILRVVTLLILPLGVFLATHRLGMGRALLLSLIHI